MKGQVTDREKKRMCWGWGGRGEGAYLLTIMFLGWLPVSGEFCSSVGTTSKSEEAP